MGKRKRHNDITEFLATDEESLDSNDDWSEASASDTEDYDSEAATSSDDDSIPQDELADLDTDTNAEAGTATPERGTNGRDKPAKRPHKGGKHYPRSKAEAKQNERRRLRKRNNVSYEGMTLDACDSDEREELLSPRPKKRTRTTAEEASDGCESPSATWTNTTHGIEDEDIVPARKQSDKKPSKKCAAEMTPARESATPEPVQHGVRASPSKPSTHGRTSAPSTTTTPSKAHQPTGPPAILRTAYNLLKLTRTVGLAHTAPIPECALEYERLYAAHVSGTLLTRHSVTDLGLLMEKVVRYLCRRIGRNAEYLQGEEKQVALELSTGKWAVTEFLGKVERVKGELLPRL